MRFLGNIEAKTDAKGRAFLPSVFRKVLQTAGEERIVMRRDVFQSCLVLYPESVWNAQMDELRSRLNRWNGRQQMLFRQFVSDVELLSLDGNGRFLIPGRYRKMANIGQSIRFVGMGDVIEIWSSDDLDKTLLEQSQFSGELEALMSADVKEGIQED